VGIIFFFSVKGIGDPCHMAAPERFYGCTGTKLGSFPEISWTQH